MDNGWGCLPRGGVLALTVVAVAVAALIPAGRATAATAGAGGSRARSSPTTTRGGTSGTRRSAAAQVGSVYAAPRFERAPARGHAGRGAGQGGGVVRGHRDARDHHAGHPRGRGEQRDQGPGGRDVRRGQVLAQADRPGRAEHLAAV